MYQRQIERYFQVLELLVGWMSPETERVPTSRAIGVLLEEYKHRIFLRLTLEEGSGAARQVLFSCHQLMGPRQQGSLRGTGQIEPKEFFAEVSSVTKMRYCRETEEGKILIQTNC